MIIEESLKFTGDHLQLLCQHCIVKWPLILFVGERYVIIEESLNFTGDHLPRCLEDNSGSFVNSMSTLYCKMATNSFCWRTLCDY